MNYTIKEKTMILPCKCVHKDQDNLNGKGLRTMNWAPKKGGYVCTVCGVVHKTNEKPIEKAKDKQDGTKR